MIKIWNFYVKKNAMIWDKIRAYHYSNWKRSQLTKIVAFNWKELELIDIPKWVF
jgi:hypothetical protein